MAGVGTDLISTVGSSQQSVDLIDLSHLCDLRHLDYGMSRWIDDKR